MQKIVFKIDDDGDAIIFYNEQRDSRRVSWKQLQLNVFKISHYLKSKNINKLIELQLYFLIYLKQLRLFLACAQIGAIWSSCSSDFGPQAIIDRFKQISPKILIITDHYFYNNKKIDTLKNIKLITSKIPSIENIIIIPLKKIIFQ